MKNNILYASLIIFILSLLSLLSCSNSKKQINTGTIDLNLFLQSHYISSSIFSISNIHLTDKNNKIHTLNNKNIEINLQIGSNQSVLLLKKSIPAGEYTEIIFDIEIDSRSFQYADNSQVKDLKLIDSINRSIPEEVSIFSFRTNLIDNSLTVEKNKHHPINLVFDADKSVQPLYRDDDNTSTTALFKPYFYIDNDLTTGREYFSNFVSSDFKILIIKPSFSNQPHEIEINHISRISLDGSTTSIEEAINYLSKNKGALIHTIDNNGYLTLTIFSQDKALSILQGKIIHQENNTQVIKGNMVKGTLPHSESNNNLEPTQFIFTPDGTQSNSNIQDVLNGQLVTGFITNDEIRLNLIEGTLVAVIESLEPLSIIPVTYNNHQMPSTTPLLLNINNGIDALNTGDFISVFGYGLSETFFASDLQLLDKNRVSLSITLPASLSDSPISDILDSGTIILQQEVSQFSKIDISLQDTAIQTSIPLEHIDINEAKISIYTDRILESNRLYTYSTSEKSIDVIKSHLLNAHHINEIHAKGVLENNTLYATEFHVVFYGASIFDVESTKDIIDQIEDEAIIVNENDSAENTQTTAQKEQKKQIGLITGITVGSLGVPVLVGGLAYYLYRKSHQPLSVSSLSQSTPQQPATPTPQQPATPTPPTPPTPTPTPTPTPQPAPPAQGSEYEIRIDDNGRRYRIIELGNEIHRAYIDEDMPTSTQPDTKITPPVKNESDKFIVIDGVKYDRTLFKDSDADFIKLDLDKWYRHEYPTHFSETPIPPNDKIIKFNGIEVQDLLVDRSLIDVELAFNYLTAYHQKNNHRLYFVIDAANNVPVSNDNALITQGALRNQAAILAEGGNQAIDRLTAFINGFSGSDKQFAILPALGATQHFNALILVKDGSTGITPIIVEPKDGSSGSSISTDIKNLLPDMLKNKAITVKLGIQQDGCSCGPIAMVAATDIVGRIVTDNIPSGQLTENRLSAIINALKQTPKYEKVDQHPRIRVDFLEVLDKRRILVRSPINDPRIQHEIADYKKKIENQQRIDNQKKTRIK